MIDAAKQKLGKKKPTAWDKCTSFGLVAICELVADCNTVEKIAEQIGVTKWDLLRFLNSDLHHDAHARAREAQADKHAADILAIADEAEVEASYKGGDVTLDISSSAVARNRLRVDARKWLAAKMAPKRYGDKLDITAAVTTSTLTDEQLMERATALGAKLGIVKA